VRHLIQPDGTLTIVVYPCRGHIENRSYGVRLAPRKRNS